MPIKKTLLSLLVCAVFGTYALFERAHNDQADIIAYAMNGFAHEERATAVPVQAPVSQPQNNATQQYADYLAQINAEAAAYKQAHPATAQQPSKPQPKSAPVPAKVPAPAAPAPRREREGNDDNGGSELDFETQKAQWEAQMSTGQGQSQYSYSAPPVDMSASVPPPQDQTVNQAQTPAPTPAPAPAPTPAPAPAPAPTPAPQGQYRDGTYTGPSVYVHYGNVQVKVTIANGKIADVTFLDYPQDRSTSRMINSQAIPQLQQEAIAAQSASVDGVSGATMTSQGFIQSLSNALSQAHV